MRCQYTGKEVAEGEGIWLGSIVPQSPTRYYCHPSAKEEYDKQKFEFDRFEANCNTCSRLERIPHDRNDFVISGLMNGKCDKFTETHPYNRGDYFKFAPSDFMGMKCYEPRK